MDAEACVEVCADEGGVVPEAVHEAAQEEGAADEVVVVLAAQGRTISWAQESRSLVQMSEYRPRFNIL